VIKIPGVDREKFVAVVDTISGYRALGDEVLQPRMINPDVTSRSPRPFIMQERLAFDPPGQCISLCQLGWNTPEKLAAAKAMFVRNPELFDALLEGMAKIGKKGLDFTDGNLPNLYFKKVGGKWKLGVLDSDFITPHSVRTGRLGKYQAAAEFDALLKCGSLARTGFNIEETVLDDWLKVQAKDYPSNPRYRQRYADMSDTDQGIVRGLFQRDPYRFQLFEKHLGPFFPDAEFTAEKMLERKGFFHYDPYRDVWTSEYVSPGGSVPLDKARIQRSFPKMFDRDRLAPLNPAGPFHKEARLAPPNGSKALGFAPEEREEYLEAAA
jgi:hypothetical protein